MTMGAFVMERTLDLLAERLHVDPAEIRRRNLIPREAYPFLSAAGFVYDSGDFPKALEMALELADYEGLKRERSAREGGGDSSASASPATRSTRAWARRPTGAAA